jgi:hypothetical protein
MELSILLVNYNQKYFSRLCIESIQKSVVNFEYEIIVCDNNSTDESVEYLKEAHAHGIIKLIQPLKNLGFGKANNIAAKMAKGKYLLILNTDITVESDTIFKMIDYMKEHKDIGILGPKLVYHNGDIQPSCRRNFKFLDLFVKRTFLKKIWSFKKRYTNYLMTDFNHKSVQEVDLITGAFMLMRRDLFDDVHGFDERYFLFMEDFDLCKKVKLKGFKIVYFPEVFAVHYHKRLSDGGLSRLVFNKISWIHLISAAKYFWKWRK